MVQKYAETDKDALTQAKPYQKDNGKKILTNPQNYKPNEYKITNV